MRSLFPIVTLVFVGSLLLGCQNTRGPVLVPAATPAAFTANVDARPVVDRWLGAFASPALSDIVERAMQRNRALAQQAHNVEIARQQVVVTGADRWPALRLLMDGQRGRSAAALPVSSAYGVTGALDFEVDLWGRLSNAQKQAELNYAGEQLRLLRAERELAARTVNAVFAVTAAKQLLSQFEQRLASLAQSLDVIERGYRSGLSPALDVYLARTTVEQEQANIANQQQVLFEANNALELLLAEYPNADQLVPDELPPLPQLAGVGVPGELLQRRSDIQQAWLQLLSADEALAVAQKNRFPVLNLSASVRDSGTSLDDLFDGGQMAWTIAASLVQPVFAGGRLRARERQARAQVLLTESRYLEVVYAGFAEAENELKRAVTLARRLEATQQASDNAEAALALAQNQYDRGLVTYTTVLEAQRRAFDAQASLIRLRSQTVQSRVTLHLALGGAY